MTEIFTWLLKMTGGDETKASIVAVSIAVIGAVVLAVGLYFATMTVLDRLPSIKERCPSCRRRSLIICWFDENDEEGTEYVFFRCESCSARFKQRPGADWEDASDPKFDTMFSGASVEQRADPLWDGDLDT
jgi:DNA-directed RNA polymerase subunit M/transcription elongation factor TFIIS